MRRQSNQAFLRPRNGLIHWMFTGAPNRGHYEVMGQMEVHLDKCVNSRWLEIDKCGDATCLWGIWLQCISKAAYLTKPLGQRTHTQSHTLIKSWKCFHFNSEKPGKYWGSDPINTLDYEALKQLQTTLMRSKAEPHKTCAETLNASKGSDFWKSKKLFTRTRESKPMGCLISNDKSLDSNADKFEHLRSTFLSDSHFHRNTFDESSLRNLEHTFTANLQQDYWQLWAQLSKEELDSALKESSFLTSVHMQALTFGN